MKSSSATRLSWSVPTGASTRLPNEADAQERPIKPVVLPIPGKKSAQRQDYEKQAWFRRGRRWHAGVEGRI